MKTLSTLAPLAACLALAACASSNPEKPMTQAGETMHFKQYDRSADAKLTRDELPTDSELFLGFETHDLNGDGEISEYEFGEYVEDMPD